MRKVHAAAALCALVVVAPHVRADDKAQAVIERAIKAQGGEMKVAQLRTMRIKVEGSGELVPGGGSTVSASARVCSSMMATAILSKKKRRG